jgi:cytochrome c
MSRSPRFWRLAVIVIALGLGASIAAAQARKPAEKVHRYGIGHAATAQEIAGWDIDVRAGRPGRAPPRGRRQDGWPPLAGGRDTLASNEPNKTVGSYFPYASSVFDYVRHAMPFGDAQSLRNDELYAVVAYLLFLNDVVDENFVLTPETFRQIKLPNAAGFFDDDRDKSERKFWSARPCMSSCKGEVKILNRARALDVTPDDKPGE